MLSSFNYIVPLIFVLLTYAVSLPPSSFLLQNLTQTVDTLHGTFPNLTAGKLKCSAIRGTGLQEASCRNALDKMDFSSTKVEIFVPRRVGGVPDSLGVPLRYLSDDGICAIDVFFYRRSEGDVTTWAVISDRAKTILDKCVILLQKGGSMTHFSYTGELFVAMKSYEPSVDCELHPTRVPSVEACDAVLAAMPAATAYKKFDSHNLPQEFSNPPGPASCRVHVDMPPNLGPTRESYFNLYAAAVAVNTMCVQNGMIGRALYLGDNHAITITLDARRHIA